MADQAPQDVSPGKVLMRHTLRLGAGALAWASLLDLGREAFSNGSWRASAGLGTVYGFILSVYALTHEWDKQDGSAPEAPRVGHLFLYAWVVLPVLIWLAQITNLAFVSWPAQLNDTLAWVFGAYAGTKALRGWHAHTRARAAKAAPRPPAPETPDQFWARNALRFGSQLLGAVCLLDAAIEMFSVGEWHFTGAIYVSYAYVLGAYAGTREWEKWTDRYDEDASWGHLFVGAWIALTIAYIAAKFLGMWVVWPSNLTFALTTVVGIWLGGKVSARQRKEAGANWWGFPAAPEVDAPPAREAGSPAERGETSKSPEPEEDPNAAEREAVSQACQARGTFTTKDIVADTGIELKRVRSFIGRLRIAGLVKKLDAERYLWVGKGGKVVYG